MDFLPFSVELVDCRITPPSLPGNFAENTTIFKKSEFTKRVEMLKKQVDG